MMRRQHDTGTSPVVDVSADYYITKQLAWVANSYAAFRKSEAGRFAVRRLNVYRLLAGFADKTIVAIMVFGWLIYLLIGAFGFLMRFVHLPIPGFWVTYPLGGVLGVLATVWLGSWWRHYRQSEDRARHQILARGGVTAGIAGRLEITRRWSAKTVVDKAEVLRPQFASRAKISRAYAIAPTLFPTEYLELCAEYGHHSPSAPAVVSEQLARTCRRVAVAWEPPVESSTDSTMTNSNVAESRWNPSPSLAEFDAAEFDASLVEAGFLEDEC